MKTVLVIDDDQQFRTAIYELLQDHGYSVLEAENGSQGWNTYRTETTDIILTGLIMPHTDSIHMIRQIRAVDRKIPIIAISEHSIGSAPNYLNILKLLGASSTLKKPFTDSELLLALQDVNG